MVTAAVSAGLALGSAIYGGIKSAQANNNARRLIQQQRDENKRWYDTVKAQDYTMRTDAQAAINRQRELLKEQYDRARKTSRVAGGTDEATALAKEAANKSLSDTMTGIASEAANYKDSVERQYRAQDAALNQQQVQSHQQQAAQTAQAASQAVNAGIGLLGNELHFGADGSAVKAGATGTPLSSVNSDLTATGNQQLGITSSGLPAPAAIQSAEEMAAARIKKSV